MSDSNNGNADGKSPVDERRALDQAAPEETEAEKRQTDAASEYKKAPEVDGKLVMQVKVYSPFRDYYDGQAFSISGENTTGPFDILPKHHNFISLLSPCDLVVRAVQKGEQKIRIMGGIMHVKADQVIVFLDV